MMLKTALLCMLALLTAPFAAADGPSEPAEPVWSYDMPVPFRSNGTFMPPVEIDAFSLSVHQDEQGSIALSVAVLGLSRGAETPGSIYAPIEGVHVEGDGYSLEVDPQEASGGLVPDQVGADAPVIDALGEGAEVYLIEIAEFPLDPPDLIFHVKVEAYDGSELDPYQYPTALDTHDKSRLVITVTIESGKGATTPLHEQETTVPVPAAVISALAGLE